MTNYTLQHDDLCQIGRSLPAIGWQILHAHIEACNECKTNIYKSIQRETRKQNSNNNVHSDATRHSTQNVQKTKGGQKTWPKTLKIKQHKN